LRETIARELARTERWRELAMRLPAVVRDDGPPPDASEKLDWAYYFHECRRYGQAARLFSLALEQDPTLVGDVNAQNRYNAACSSALAAASQGKEEPVPSERERTRLRQRANDYLKADLTTWATTLRGGSQADVGRARQSLRHCKVDPDLSSVRELATLAKLPEAERAEWIALWTMVDASLEQTGR
jgi:hypothetical protein